MTARRPRVLAGESCEFEALLLEAELHDVIVLNSMVEGAVVVQTPFVVVRDADDELWARSLMSARCSTEYRLGLDVTDQYVDAYDTFADVRIWFGASSRLSLVMAFSPRDAGVLRMLGGRPLPPPVNYLIVGCRPDAVDGYFVLDDCSVDKEFEVGISWICFMLLAPGNMRSLHAALGRSLWHMMVPHHEVYLDDDNWTMYRALPTPLAKHWRQINNDWRQRERVGEVFIYIQSHDRDQHLQGPETGLSEQLRLIGDAAGLSGDERFVATPGRLVHVHYEQSHWWRSVSRRIVQAVAQLAQLEPRLSSYVMLWIVDKLPGCVFYPELRKLRCVEATADRIRAKLDSTTK
jgi:hypothetical protein